MPTYDPEKMYRLKLTKAVRHGDTLLRPRDDHVVLGSAIADITPQDGIESATEVIQLYNP